MFFEVSGITKSYGGLVANSDISLEFEEGAIVGLIGPNGAGKSTLFKTISGYVVPDRGRIAFRGAQISGLAPHRVCKAGIACTFQDAKSFPKLEMFETILVGAYCRHGNKRRASARAGEIIDFVGLGGKESQMTERLNMFDRKKVELAAALATEPELLLLDELFAGCTPTEVVELLKLLKKANETLGVTLFIIEHVLKVIMSACQKVVVLDYGEVLDIGTPDEIVRSKKVVAAYLGEDYDASQYK
ncbi:MAG: ATP-binding cassette domain-containing protein [Clostridiales Family XIII bacterium]|nr:ATP-binding cassette domain-containing protein [Clostridiales Family XIII bacterium]